MHTRRSVLLVVGAVLLFAGAVLLPARPVAAQSPTPTPSVGQCIQSARQTNQDCKSVCDDDFVAAKFICQGIPPSCGLPCLAGFTACRQAVENILDTGQVPNPTPGGPPIPLDNCSGGTNACDQTFQNDKQACYAASCTAFPPPPACGSSCQPADLTTCPDCIDTAQVNHFLCRDACRDSWRIVTKGMKKACRKGFAACKKACMSM